MYSLAIHGGVLNVSEKSFRNYAKHNKYLKNLEFQWKESLHEYLEIGQSMLKKNYSAMEVVEEIIKLIENNPIFNSGTGSKITNNGTYNLSSCIMDGKHKEYSMSSNISNIKNPIVLSKTLLDNNIRINENNSNKYQLDTIKKKFFENKQRKTLYKLSKKIDSGTVGCIAIDQNSNICVGTSSGKITNISNYNNCIIGSTIYADNQFGGICISGKSDEILKHVGAYDIIAQSKYLDKTLEHSIKTFMNRIKRRTCGIIGIDSDKNITINFNTHGFLRAYIKNGKHIVKLWRE